MARSFDITAASESIRLDGSRQGEISFTVSNAIGSPVRGRVVLEPEGQTRPEWLSVDGQAERDFTVDGTHTYTVKVSVPQNIPEGTHAFHPLVVDVASPDERYARGPSVGFQVPRPFVPPKKRFPWWIPVAAVGGVALIVLIAALWPRGGGEQDAGTGGSGVTEADRLRFNGINSYVDLGAPAYLDISGPITLEAWIRPLAIDGVRDIVAHGYALNPPGEVFLRILDGAYQVGSWPNEAIASTPVPPEDLGNWVHLAGVHDGTQWLLYRNGVKVASAPTPTGSVPVAGRWAIGARGGGSERFFWGDIRDVRIWSIARPPEDIRAGMTQPPGGNEAALLGNWPLADGKGSMVKDLSSHGRQGIIRGTLWMTPTSPPPGLTFNGSNAFVSLGDPDALDFIGPITIEAWVKPLATDGLRNIVARDSSTNPPGAVFLRIWDGKYQIGSWNGIDHLAAAPVPPEDLDRWVHLAGVYDGIQWSLYRNGEKVASSMDSIGAVPANVRWAIGAQSDGAGRYFKGSIRDVRIWLIARTPEELRAGMGQPLSGQEDGLAGYWPMNEGQGTTLRDLAGRNTGSLQNGLW